MAKTVTLNLVINAEIERKLKREAKEHQRSMSGQLRVILNERYELEKQVHNQLKDYSLIDKTLRELFKIV